MAPHLKNDREKHNYTRYCSYLQYCCAERIDAHWGNAAGGPRLLVGVEKDEEGNDIWYADVMQAKSLDRRGDQDNITGERKLDFVKRCKGGKTEAEALENMKRALDEHGGDKRRQTEEMLTEQREMGIAEEVVRIRTVETRTVARKVPPAASKPRGRPPKTKVEDPEDSADDLNSSPQGPTPIKKKGCSTIPEAEDRKASKANSANVVDLTLGPKEENSPKEEPAPSVKQDPAGNSISDGEDESLAWASKSTTPTISSPTRKRKRQDNEVVEMDSDSSNIKVAVPESAAKKRPKTDSSIMEKTPDPVKNKKMATKATAKPGVKKELKKKGNKNANAA